VKNLVGKAIKAAMMELVKEKMQGAPEAASNEKPEAGQPISIEPEVTLQPPSEQPAPMAPAE